MLGISLKGVPAFARNKMEEAQIGCNLCRIPAFPWTAIHRLWHERTNKLTVLKDQFPCFDTGHHAVHPHVAPTLPLVHAGVDIQGGKQRIERAGGGVHHKGVVEALMRDIARLAFYMAVLLMDLRGLREARLLLMHRLGNQNARIVFVQLQQQRRAVGHHRDKLLVTHPGGVKQNVIAQVTNLIHHLTGVINGTVVGAQLDHRQTEGTFIPRATRRDL